MQRIEYITDENGNKKAVVIPMEIWEKVISWKNVTIADLSESLEDYCLAKAMDEALESPAITRYEAMEYSAE